MKIAVTYADGNIFQHFGHSAFFKVYEVENDEIVNSQIISTNGSGHGTLATLLSGLKIDVLICGGIAGGAQLALANAGIRLYGGVHGDADEAVLALLDGQLVYNPNVQCNHHGHENGGHNCQSERCGGNCHK